MYYIFPAARADEDEVDASSGRKEASWSIRSIRSIRQGTKGIKTIHNGVVKLHQKTSPLCGASIRVTLLLDVAHPVQALSKITLTGDQNLSAQACITTYSGHRSDSIRC